MIAKRNYFFILFILVLIITFGYKLLSPIEKEPIENKFIGEWINVDEFNPPEIFNFNKYYVEHNLNGYVYKYLYIPYRDTIFFAGPYLLENKPIFSISESLLKLKRETYFTGSPKSNFKKNTYGNYLDFCNEHLNLSIELPSFEKGNFEWERFDNTVFVNEDNLGNPRIIIDGIERELSDSVYKYIRTTVSSKRVVLFVDKNLLYKKLLPLRREIKKSWIPITVYISKNKDNNLIGTDAFHYDIRLTKDELDLDSNSPPKPQRTIEWRDIYKHGAVFTVINNRLFYNDKQITINEIKETIESNFKFGIRNDFLVYFGPDTIFDTFLKVFSKLKSDLKEKRKEFIKEKYNVNEVYQLTDQNRKELYKTFIYSVSEITEKEFNELKTLKLF